MRGVRGVVVGVSDSVDSGAMSQLHGGVAVLVGHGDSQKGGEDESLKHSMLFFWRENSNLNLPSCCC